MLNLLEHPVMNLGENIYVFVITGGPCAGKSTAMSRLRQFLSDRGYKVIVSPESATKLMEAGMAPGEISFHDFQKEIFLDILAQEERMFSIAMRYRDLGKKVVVLCDRGTLDAEAYMGSAAFEKMITSFGYSYRDLCDGRYHAVIHMRTAALGAEKFYTLSNNPKRTENLAEALALDERTLAAWTRHHHPRVVDNSTDFDQKIRRVFVEICSVLGDPVPLEKEAKFLIELPDLAHMPVKWYENIIVQNYLESLFAQEKRVRARSDQSSTSYYFTTKSPYISKGGLVVPGERIEQEKMITKREYDILLTLRDARKQTIRKRRICFFFAEQFFEVDIFEEPTSVSGLVLMEAEFAGERPTLRMPPFIKVIREVTGEKQYSNSFIASGGK